MALALPAFTNPKNQEILTVSVGYTIRVLAPDDSAVNFKVNGSTVGAMTYSAPYWQYTYTPGAVASSTTLTAEGNVTGVGPAIDITIAEANGLDQTMTTWSTNGRCSVTAAGAGVTDPDGGTNAYDWKVTTATSGQYYIYKSVTGSVTDVFNSNEIWVTPKNPGTPGAITKINFNNTAAGACMDVGPDKAGQNTAAVGYSWIAEKRTIGGRDWYRIQWIPSASSTTHNPTYHYMTTDFQNGNFTGVANDGLYVYKPRAVSTTRLNPTINQKLACYFDSVIGTIGSSGGYERWYYKHPYVDTVTNMAGGPGGIELQVVKPNSGWSLTANLPMLVALKPQTDGAETGSGNQTTLTTFTVDPYANTYNCVVVMPYERPSEGYWWGVMSTGAKNMIGFLGEVLVPYAIQNWGVSRLRNDHLMIGYSKSGNAVFTQILFYPAVWGFIAAWDGAYNNAYPSNNANISYDNSTIYNAYDPLQQLTAKQASVLDAKRIVLLGYYTWGADQLSMKSALDGLGIQYDYNRVLQSKHSWGSSTSGNVWTPDAVQRLFALRAATIGNLPSFTWSGGVLDAMYW